MILGFFSFNSLPNGNILDSSKLKAFADNKTNATEMFISLLDTVENTGKRRKCWLPNGTLKHLLHSHSGTSTNLSKKAF